MESRAAIYFVCAILLLLSQTIFCQVKQSHFCLTHDRLLLLHLKNAYPISALSSWTGDDCCQSKGVRCDNQTSHLIRLDLHRFFPCLTSDCIRDVNPAVFGLRHLKYLDLSSNHFGGALPTGILELKELQYLDLSSNVFEGLDLSNNQLQGNLSNSHIQNLTSLLVLDVSANSLEGNISLSAFDQQYFPSLLHLSLSDNKFTVYTNPAWIPLTQFERLSLRSCNIRNVIPPFISTQYNITDLDLSNNDLFGNIPTWLADLPSLSSLNLSHNNLEGPLPETFNWNKYRVLDLHDNKLNGTLPIPNSPLSNVFRQFLDLSQNNFSGHIPPQIGTVLPSLQFLSLSANNLTGAIPGSIGHLQSLQVLDLSSNQFSGKIPWRSIFSCSDLSILNLAHIGLEGHIPSNMEIGSLTHLRTLHLDHNGLNGTFPLFLQNCTELQILDIGSNRLSGKIPSWLAQLSKLKILVLRSNNFEGPIPPEISHMGTSTFWTSPRTVCRALFLQVLENWIP